MTHKTYFILISITAIMAAGIFWIGTTQSNMPFAVIFGGAIFSAAAIILAAFAERQKN